MREPMQVLDLPEADMEMFDRVERRILEHYAADPESIVRMTMGNLLALFRCAYIEGWMARVIKDDTTGGESDA